MLDYVPTSPEFSDTKPGQFQKWWHIFCCSFRHEFPAWSSVYLSNVDLDGGMVLGSDDSVARRARKQHISVSSCWAAGLHHPGFSFQSHARIIWQRATHFLYKSGLINRNPLTTSSGRKDPRIHQRRSACWSCSGVVYKSGKKSDKLVTNGHFPLKNTSPPVTSKLCVYKWLRLSQKTSSLGIKQEY